MSCYISSITQSVGILDWSSNNKDTWILLTFPISPVMLVVSEEPQISAVILR